MATKTIVQVTDDLDESTDDVQTVSLSYDGGDYEIDLSAANRQALDEALSKYINVARRTGGRRKRGSATKTTKTTAVASDNAAVRSWAQANKIPVSPRGRISADVREQFEAANK